PREADAGQNVDLEHPPPPVIVDVEGRLGPEDAYVIDQESTCGTRSKICCAPALVATSAVIPFAPSCAATASTRAGSIPFTMTSAPARASISAIALPIPAVEPVTSAMRAVRSIFMSSSLDSFLAAGGSLEVVPPRKQPILAALSMDLSPTASTRHIWKLRHIQGL